MRPAKPAPVIAAQRGVLLFAVCVSSASSQGFGPQQVITNEAVEGTSVYTIDLDGDGDPDALSASRGAGLGSKVAWYENLGAGTFGPQQLITTASSPSFVYATDLDGDGDADVLLAFSNQVAWYENLGGGNFGPQRVITTAVQSAKKVYAIDLDGDGDPDVLSASESGFSSGEIAWYENLGAGTFGPQQVIVALADDVHAIDLDGDGDADILSAGLYRLAWHENLGAGTFGPQQAISNQLDFARSVNTADLDGDGDADVLSRLNQSQIVWYENLGAGTFGPKQHIASGQPVPAASADQGEVDAMDLDGDGDADILFVPGISGEIGWCENLGAGTFGPQQLITTAGNGAIDVDAADFDGDGDVDILSTPGTYLSGVVGWNENFSGIGMRYCSPAITNSTGEPGSMEVRGSKILFLNDIALAAHNLSLHSPGYFITSRTPGYTYPVSNSQGALCIQGLVGRYVGPGQILNSGATGSFSLQISVNSMPTPTGPVLALPGETWNFQAWHRDANPAVTSNFTDAISVTFE